MDPTTGSVKQLALKAPQGLALDAAGDVIVADAKSGVVAVAADGGDQSPYTAPGAVVGARGVAVGLDGGIYVTESGPAPGLKATAAARQRFRRSGIALTLRPTRTATVGYTAAISIAGRPGFTKGAAFRGVQGRRGVWVTLPGQVDARIATALRQGRRVTARVKLWPQDPRSGTVGNATVLHVRLVA